MKQKKKGTASSNNNKKNKSGNKKHKNKNVPMAAAIDDGTGARANQQSSQFTEEMIPKRGRERWIAKRS